MFLSGRKKFNLEKHLTEVANKYCDGMSETAKKEILDRITSLEGNKGFKGKKIYSLPDLSPKNFPTNKTLDEMEKEGKLYPINDAAHQNAENKVNELIKDFSSNDSQVSKDLNAILAESHVTIRARKWGRKNASVVYKEKEGKEKKNEIVIFVSDELLKKTPYDEALPGFLTHELGHVLEFSQRPKGCEKEYMDGAETTADIIGTRLAIESGHDSRGFGKFMGDDFRDNKIVYDFTPTGKFREDTMNIAYNQMNKTKQEKSKVSHVLSTSQNSIAQKLRELQGVSRPPSAYNKPQIPRSSTSGLRYVPKSGYQR